MHNVIARFLLLFLIAWLPVSLAHAAVPGCHMAMEQQAGACQQMHHDGQVHQTGAGHAPSGCHNCSLCHSCVAAMPAVAAIATMTVQALHVSFAFDHFASFFPEQPERPPRA